MKKRIALLILLLYPLNPFAQGYESILQKVNENPPTNINFYTEQYDELKDIHVINTVFAKLNSNLEDHQRTLNRLGFIKELIKYQYASIALEFLNKYRASFESGDEYIKGEYLGLQGLIAATSGDTKQAKIYFEKSAYYLEKTKELKSIKGVYMNLGNIYMNLDQYDKSSSFFLKAEEIEKSGILEARTSLLINQSILAFEIGDQEKSFELINLARLNAEKENNDFDRLSIANIIASLYWEQNNLKAAEQNYLAGIELAKKLHNRTQESCIHRNISEFYSETDNSVKALFHLNACDSIEKNFSFAPVSAELVKSDLNFKVKQEQIENEKKSLAIKVKEQQMKFLIFLITGLIFIAALLFIYQYKLKSKNKALLVQNRKLAESKESSVRVAKNGSTDPSQYSELIMQLEKFVLDENGYTKANLSLDKLAKKLGTNRTYLSEAINSHYRMNFNQWINEIRIDASRKLLISKEHQHFSIEGIAQMVGFGSISTFNTSFKRITGLTPSYFRNSL